MLAFFGTVWGHLAVQAVVGGAQIFLNGVGGVGGPYAAVIQAAAAIGSELIAAMSSETMTPGGGSAVATGVKPTTVGR